MMKVKRNHFDNDPELRDLTHPLMTGDRAVIATADLDFAVTVNEFGMPSYARALLAYCKMTGAPSPEESTAGWLALAATAADLLGPRARHVGLSRFEDSPFANQDWATYTIRGWDVVSQDFMVSGRREANPYPMGAALTVIASTQGSARRVPDRDLMALAAGREVPALRAEEPAGEPRAWVTTRFGDVAIGIVPDGAGRILAAACAWCASRGFPSPAGSHYGWGRLAECLANWLGAGALSLERDVGRQCASAPDGVWGIEDGWRLVSPDDRVLDPADAVRDEATLECVRELDAAQPHGARLGMRPRMGTDGIDTTGRGLVA